jgi:hypothetical protein
MNQKHLRLSALLLVSLTTLVLPRTEAFAKNGGGVSGGADFHVVTGAWFTSDSPEKSIRACMRVAPNFGFTAARLSEFIGEAFEKWAQYYERVSPPEPTPSAEDRARISGADRYFWHRIVARVAVSATCKGDEDLVFYFGVENSQTRSRKGKYNSPLGFSELLQPLGLGEPQNAWSRGLVWIAPPKSIDPKKGFPTWTNFDGLPLRALLLHEVGHIFGNGHVDRTIMRDDIAARIESKARIDIQHASPRSLNDLNSIDGTGGVFALRMPLEFETKLRPRMGDCVYVTGVAKDGCESGNQQIHQMIFKHLAGRDLFGRYDELEMKVTKHGLKKLAGSRYFGVVQASQGNATIVLKDRVGSVTLRFTGQMILSTNRNMAGDRFRLPRRAGISSDSVTIYGVLETPRGRVPMVANYNTEANEFGLVDPNLRSRLGKDGEKFEIATACNYGGSCPLLISVGYSD